MKLRVATLAALLALGSSSAFAQSGPVTCSTTGIGAHGRSLACTDGTLREVTGTANGVEVDAYDADGNLNGQSATAVFSGDWGTWTDSTGATCTLPVAVSMKLDVWPVACPS